MGNSQSLKDLRKSAGLTQAQAGVALGYTKDSISRIERGLWAFPVSKWPEVAVLYRCSVETVALAVAKTMEKNYE
jgi:transcriptional regulator with XRE-family HTH domain